MKEQLIETKKPLDFRNMRNAPLALIHQQITDGITLIRMDFPHASPSEFYGKVAEFLPGPIPFTVQEKALKALWSDNSQDVAMGGDVFVSLNLKTICSVLQPYQKVYEGDYDDLFQFTIERLLDMVINRRKAFEKRVNNTSISQTVLLEAHEGARQHIVCTQHIPHSLTDVKNYAIFMTHLHEAYREYGRELSPQARKDVAQKISQSTGVSEELIKQSLTNIVYESIDGGVEDTKEKRQISHLHSVVSKMDKILSKRELTVFRMYAEGNTFDQIGQAVGISREGARLNLMTVANKIRAYGFRHELIERHQMMLEEPISSHEIVEKYTKQLIEKGRKGLGVFTGEMTGLDVICGEHFFAGKKVMDIGCSTQRLSRGQQLENCAVLYDAIDSQTPEDTIIGRRFYYRGDVKKIQKDPRFEKETYDVCMVSGAGLQSDAVLQVMQDVLKTGGIGIIEDAPSTVVNHIGLRPITTYIGTMDYHMRSVQPKGFTTMKKSFDLSPWLNQHPQEAWKHALHQLVKKGQIPNKFLSPDYYGSMVDTVDRLFIVKKID